MTIYPNPASNNLNVTFEGTGAKELTVDLYSIDGQKVQGIYNGISVSGRNEMNSNITNLSKGVYLVRILFEGQSFVQKLIVN